MAENSGQKSVGEQIVTASTDISMAAAKLTLTETAAPQKGFYYLNNHVKQLMAQTALQSHQLGEHQAKLKASLSDIKHTVKDTKELADMNGEFSDSMLAQLNRLLLDVSQ